MPAPYGVTDVGFVRKTRPEIVGSLLSRADSLFNTNPDIEKIDLSETSEDRLRIEMFSDEVDFLWQLAEEVYNSNFASTATGVSLRRVTSDHGVEWKPDQAAITTLVWTGVDGKKIQVGALAGTDQGVQFIVIQEGQIESGSCETLAQAVEPGTGGNVPANTITTILTPMADVSSVTNPQPASDGSGMESDGDLYERFSNRGVNGGSSASNIQFQLNALPNVLNARVYENVKKTTINGLPPSSMEAVIQGGEPSDFTKIFLKYWPGGIESIGTESVSTTDEKGLVREYKYSRPEILDLVISIEITVDPNVFLSSSIDIIKTNCAKLVGGPSPSGETFAGKGIGRTIFAWEIGAIQLGSDLYKTSNIPGIVNISALVGTTIANEQSVSATIRQIPRILPANISINIEEA